MPLDEAGVRAAVAKLREKNVEAVAVCLLHSYANPAHERAARDVVKELWPEAYLCTSSDVLPEFREFERFATTTVNASLMPIMDRYLERFERGGHPSRVIGGVRGVMIETRFEHDVEVGVVLGQPRRSRAEQARAVADEGVNLVGQEGGVAGRDQRVVQRVRDVVARVDERPVEVEHYHGRGSARARLAPLDEALQERGLGFGGHRGDRAHRREPQQRQERRRLGRRGRRPGVEVQHRAHHAGHAGGHDAIGSERRKTRDFVPARNDGAHHS